MREGPGDRAPNVGSDPINPAYYAGKACAEIIEHMPTNVGLAVKYAWRLGEKDTEEQEAGKAIWYLRREVTRYNRGGLSSTGWWFDTYASERIKSAIDSGKLDLRRSEIASELVLYAVDLRVKHLKRAIVLLEQYLD